MICGAIIPFDIVKSITGATTDAEASTQGRTVIEMLETYFGKLLVKQDFENEKVTVPYALTRVITPKHAPINSVSALEIITRDGTYKADTHYLAVGQYAVELLEQFWYHLPRYILPDTIAGVKISYNAGYFNSWAEFPGILQTAALELLKYRFTPGFVAGFNSEHLGDYSYTKGTLVNGIPAEIAGLLDGLVL